MKILITAGPTREAIDPVRFVSNHSSGRMGFALAAQAAKAGHTTRLISGPVSLRPPRGLQQTIPVTTAQEMFHAVQEHFPWCDALIMAAAVADWRPKNPGTRKLKKQDGPPAIQWMRTPDILTTIAKQKRANQRICGFAAEVGDPIPEAQRKLKAKHLDLIAANDVSLPGAGFSTPTNIITLLYADGRIQPLPKLSKPACARHILAALTSLR